MSSQLLSFTLLKQNDDDDGDINLSPFVNYESNVTPTSGKLHIYSNLFKLNQCSQFILQQKKSELKFIFCSKIFYW